ncbi:MAG: alpha/beta fold hydrolase [Acidimicrobiales bacterium]
MPTVEIRDTTIHYEQAGSGPDLLFVHGMCGDARVWDVQIELLRGHYACTTYDRRGHSRSPRGDAAESDATHAADAATLIEALDLDPVVVASSGGARIAVELLRRRPDLVRGAVLSEPPLFSLDPDAARGFLAEMIPLVEEALDHHGPGAAVDAFFSFVCPGLWSRLDDTARDRYRANAPAMLAEFEAPPNLITVGDLAGVRTPALVLSGADSHPVLRGIATVLARALPDSRWVEIRDCGHVTYAEQPEAFAAAVGAFAHDVLSPAAHI